MATTIKVKPNQSMQDVIIQATGSLNAAIRFCIDNDVSLSDTPAVDTEYIVSDAALSLGSPEALKYFSEKGIIIGTLGEAAPVMPLLNEDDTPLLNEDGSPLLNEDN